VKKLPAMGFVLLALVLIAGFAACKSSGSSDKRDTPAAETPAGDDEGSTPTSEETPEGDGDSDGAGGADLEKYFRTLEEIAIRTDSDLETVSNEIGNAVFTTDQEEIDGVRAALQQTGTILETAALQVAALEPPSEVQSDNDALRDALIDLTALTSNLLQAIEDVTTSAELDAAIDQTDPQFTAGDEALDSACFALQDIADGNGVSVDLQCGDG
jgi:hypothetical protein